ncbi:metallopeptidase TldD-related protein [Candidatus Pelagibacter sp.]|nr:metallopeptidase TldD-related protein [Candidatus Pelagibacter sp.]
MVKDQEYLNSIASQTIEYSKKLGATDVNVEVVHSISETVNLRNKQLDESNRSDSFAIGITTYINKKKSSISSSNLSKDNIKILTERCIETAKITPDDEFNSLPDKELMAKNFENLDLYDDFHVPNNKKIDILNEAEEAASKETKIINTETDFTENKSNFVLANSNGFMNGYKTSNFNMSCVAVAKKDNQMERDYDFTSKRHFSDLINPSNIGESAASNTVKKLDPKKIKSEKIGVVFDKKISKGILNVLSSAISAAAISRGTSFLKNKIGEEIFSKSLNVIDDPKIKKGLGSKNFDSEGVDTKNLKLIENGVLKSYLVDTYYGKKLNLKSNGRSGGASNLYFENGSIPLETLLKSSKKNLYITETIGHGTNLVTGDYSVGANGFMVENGEFIYPISEITIAGNFKEIFKNITLANDLEFKYSTNAPTLLVEGMIVAGT